VPLSITFVAYAPRQPRYNEIRNIPQRTSTSDVTAKLPPVKKEKEAATKAAATPPVSGADLPGLAISKIDVDAKPIYEPAGKPITQVNIDEGNLICRPPMGPKLTSKISTKMTNHGVDQEPTYQITSITDSTSLRGHYMLASKSPSAPNSMRIKLHRITRRCLRI
jgi:hypothetical protein